jgi:predicted dehydrogenase
VLATAAEYKIDCLCQKPLARDFDEAGRIVGDAKGKIRLCVNENRRHLPYYRTARQWIAEGLIGKVQQGSITAFRSSFLPDADGKYSGTPLLVKGPRLFLSEAFIHQIDALRSMVGNVRLIASRSMPTEPALEGETMCTMMLETTDGAPIVLSGSSVAIGYPREFNDKFEIFGKTGSITWDGAMLRLLGPNAREEHFDMQGRYAEMYQSCFTIAAREFADAIRNKKPFPAEATDNLETLKIVEDGYRLSGTV